MNKKYFERVKNYQRAYGISLEEPKPNIEKPKTSINHKMKKNDKTKSITENLIKVSKEDGQADNNESYTKGMTKKQIKRKKKRINQRKKKRENKMKDQKEDDIKKERYNNDNNIKINNNANNKNEEGSSSELDENLEKVNPKKETLDRNDLKAEKNSERKKSKNEEMENSKNDFKLK